MAEARTPRIDFWTLTGGKELLQEQGFRRLLITRTLAQIGQNALFFGLFVLVADQTDASIYTGLLVLSFAVPSATLGPLSGVVVDRVSRGWLLVVMNGLRLLLCIGVVASDQSLGVLYGFSLLLAASGQFVGPAESAALAQVVEREELTVASSLFNLVALGGQVLGMAVLAPVFLKTVGAEPLFILAAGFFGAAAVAVAGVSQLTAPPLPAYRSFKNAQSGVRGQFARAWQKLRQDRQSYMAVVVSVMGSTALLVGVTVLPRYGEDVLKVSTENLIFIFAPGAIGIFLGLRFAGWVAGLLGKGGAIKLGFGLLVTSLLSFGLTGRLGAFLADQNMMNLFDPGPFDERSGRIIVTMITAVVMGVAYSFIGVASRALINERVAVEMQGRVFAALAVLTNLASIVPLLVAGALADWWGVQPVLVTTAVLMFALAFWMSLTTRFPAIPTGAADG